MPTVADPIRLYLDEDTSSRALIRALRSRAVDLLTAREAGLGQTPDEHHLECATSLQRTVFTYNVRDFARLHQEYLETGRHHAGIVASEQLPVGVVVRRLLKLLAAWSADDMQDRFEFLSNWR